MANEIKYGIVLDFLKGVRHVDTRNMGVTGLSITVSGTDYHVGTQTIGTVTAEAILLGDITTPGVIVVKNLDATNYVDFSRATFSAGNGTVRIKAGEAQIFRFASTTPFALAVGGNVEIAYIIIED